MFKVLIAPTAYKGSFSPARVASAMAVGIKQGFPDAETVILPLADGGDGTVESVNAAAGGDVNTIAVEGPTGQTVLAKWLRLEALAVVELASASGIAWLGTDKLDPLHAHTRGLGQVVCHAVDSGLKKIVITVGGSASTDGGTGALAALGAGFLDEDGKPLAPGGGNLNRLKKIALSGLVERLAGIELKVATDVTNPLLGKNGAAQIFGPQKGAGPEEIVLLENGLKRFADLLEAEVGKYVRNVAGAGAAGGTAFGFAAAAEAEIINGFDWIAELTGLADKVGESNLVVTGEGRIDSASLTGKVLGGLLDMCRSSMTPLWVIPARIAGSFDSSLPGIAGFEEACGDEKTADLDDITAAAARLAQRIRPGI